MPWWHRKPVNEGILMRRFVKSLIAIAAALPLAAGQAMAETPDDVQAPGNSRVSNSGQPVEAVVEEGPSDTFEGYNRAMFSFNEGFDDYIYRPVAKGYTKVVPEPIRKGVTNFFGNIRDVWYAANHFMQGNAERGVKDLARVTANTIFGIGGLIDVGTTMHIEKEKADFGQTLGIWGVGSGPYVVLPILGDSTVRDTIALPAEWYGDPWSYVRKIRVRNVGLVIRAVNYRANLLDASDFVDEVALDKYEFRRDAYLQRRRAMIEGKSTAAWETQTSDPFINPVANAAELRNVHGTDVPVVIPDASAPSVPQTVPVEASASEKAIETSPVPVSAEQAK